MHPLVADAGRAGLLDLNGTFIAEVIGFIAMVLILARFVYPPIVRAATEREKKIAEGVKAAEESQRQLAATQEQVAQTLNEARDQAREIISRAHRDAAGEAEEARARARQEAEALIKRAQSEIGAERDRAIQELRQRFGELVVQATTRILSESIDASKHQRLIDEALAKVSESSPTSGRRA